jgi:hypothetical protein
LFGLGDRARVGDPGIGSDGDIHADGHLDLAANVYHRPITNAAAQFHTGAAHDDLNNDTNADDFLYLDAFANGIADKHTTAANADANANADRNPVPNSAAGRHADVHTDVYRDACRNTGDDQYAGDHIHPHTIRADSSTDE